MGIALFRLSVHHPAKCQTAWNSAGGHSVSLWQARRLQRPCRDIAEQKMQDLNAFDLDQAARMIAGTARSMGIKVKGAPKPA